MAKKYYEGSKLETRVAMTRAEQETQINWSADDNVVHVFTANPVVIRKFDKLVQKHPEVYSLVREEDWKGNRTCFYRIADAKYISFRGPVAISEDRKKEMAARLKEMREKKQESQNA